MVNQAQIKTALLIVAGGMAGHFGGEVISAFADNLPTTSTVLDEGVIVPYDGYLMLDSAPVNQVAQNLRFSLYESASGGTAQWVETQAVDINSGRFSAALGKGVKVSSDPANATFSEVILDAEKLYIGVEVDDGTGNFIELAGRQAIEATPFAAWAATSADFNVENNLTVESNAQVHGNLGVTNDANVGGTANVNNLTVTGAASFGDVSTSGTLTTGGGLTANGLVIANQGISLNSGQDITGVGRIQGDSDLHLFGDANAGAATGDVQIEADGDVVVAADLTVNGSYKNVMNSVTFSAHSRTSAGTIDLIPISDGFCALSQVEIQTGDSSNVQCRVFRSTNGFWRLTNFEQSFCFLFSCRFFRVWRNSLPPWAENTA